MQLLPLDTLGARQTGASTLEFGIFLPWTSTALGQQLFVKIIHELDQFLQSVPPVRIPMTHSVDPRYGDLWTAALDLTTIAPPTFASAWGKPGQYVYRYCLSRSNGPEIDWIIDPYAREYGVGKQSAITLGYTPYVWSAAEANWRTPALQDLTMYELNLAEFAQSIDGAIDRLDYLADLGVNCIQLMPISNVASEVDWGYLPVGYFGVDERYGQRSDLQSFIDAAHQRGLAVILDSVYGHSSRALFAYSYLYTQLGYDENPFMGPFAEDLFSDQGASTDYRRVLTQDFFYTVSMHFLDAYHVDGFRYDCIPNYWDGAVGVGYANLSYSTFQAVQANIATGGYWQRFAGSDPANPGCNLIQCAEQLEDPVGILYQSYSSCTWQNGTLGAAQAVARGAPGALYQLGASLALFGYPDSVISNGLSLSKTALQYIENHDHSRFISNFASFNPDDAGNYLFLEGDRSQWYKLQPYLIGVLMAKGIPLLWQGQEFGESYTLPDNGEGRVELLRPVRWDEFYDPDGQALIGLVRKLLAIRRAQDAVRRGEHYFYNDDARYQSQGALVFHRRLGAQLSVVALNFTANDVTVPFIFPSGGHYVEQLNAYAWDVEAGVEVGLQIPSNYGRIWTLS